MDGKDKPGTSRKPSDDHDDDDDDYDYDDENFNKKIKLEVKKKTDESKGKPDDSTEELGNSEYETDDSEEESINSKKDSVQKRDRRLNIDDIEKPGTSKKFSDDCDNSEENFYEKSKELKKKNDESKYSDDFDTDSENESVSRDPECSPGGSDSEKKSKSSKNKVPAISIQYLSMEKLRKFFIMCNITGEPKACAKIICDDIINRYNAEQQTGYTLESLEWIVENEYVVIKYSYQSKRQTALNKYVSQGTHTTINYCYIIFYYRVFQINQDGKIKNETSIIAATNGRAYSVIKKYADYAFSFRMAELIGNPSKITEIVRHNLLGDALREYLSGSPYLKFYTISNPYYLIDHFICKVQTDTFLSKIFKQELFSVKFTATGLLRIFCQMNPEDIHCILHLFSMEYTKDREGTQDGVFEFLHFLTPAQLSSRKLNLSLAETIFDQYHKNQKLLFKIKHKYLEEFLSSSNFKIKFGSSGSFKSIEPSPPQIHNIIREINEATEERFIKKILHGTLEFTDIRSKHHNDKIIDFIEGKLIHSNGEPYFKAKKKWYQIRKESLHLLHKDYTNLLKKALIREDEKGWLPHAWKQHANETAYNRLYIKDKDYFVFDQILPLNMEPCDILWYTEDTVYLYHVKNGFNRDTRVVCSQIFNAASHIRDALSMKQTHNYLERLWDQSHCKNTTSKDGAWFKEVKDKLLSLGKEEFINIFSSRNIVFVYAYCRNSDTSLWLDLDKPYSVTSRDLGGGAEGERNLQILKELKYLNENGRLNNKSYYDKRKEKQYPRKELEEKGVLKEDIQIMLKALENASSSSDSTLAKLEVVQVSETLRSWGFEFKMCEIPQSYED